MYIEINGSPNKQDWIIEKNKDYPYVIIDNWFTKKEILKIIVNEKN